MCKSMEHEIQALRRMAVKGFNGQPAATYAFGGVRLGQLLQGDLFRDFYLTIRMRGAALALEVDSYTAREGRWARLRDDFDMTAWEAGLIHASAGRADRSAFRSLHRIARVLLADMGLRIAGQTLHVEKAPHAAWIRRRARRIQQAFHTDRATAVAEATQHWARFNPVHHEASA